MKNTLGALSGHKKIKLPMSHKKKQEVTGLLGCVVFNKMGEVLFADGCAAHPDISLPLADPEWLTDALHRRLVVLPVGDDLRTGLVSTMGGHYLLLLFADAGENVAKFMTQIDFAFDIMEHILTDPFDAMVVVDRDKTLRYLSPVHENFFGLKPGEGIGEPLTEVIPTSRLNQIMETGIAEVGQILQLGDTQRIVSRHPIRHQGEIVGAIGRVMFKGPEQVERMSKRISMLEQKIAQYEEEAKNEIRASDRFLDMIVGQSPAIEAVKQQIRKIAPLDLPVLVQGESGTGKELVAWALHMLSPRSGARLVTVNAAAMPATLVESELFGYEAGSFTGANRKGRQGKFEQADRGTIFLDEIGDMPIEVQSKLLRVLQDRVVERVGGAQPKHVDFRLCSATNHDLEDLIDDGRFRLDLYYRISPVCIRMPSLAERLEDIPLLLQHFLGEYCDKYGMERMEVDRDVPDYLMSRSWPGNVRQLRHEVERAFVFAEQGRLSIDNFEQSDSRPRARVNAGAATGRRAGGLEGLNSGTIKDAVDQLENELISEAMVRFRGNKQKVAKQLGISRSYLYKKLDLLQIPDQ